MTLVLTESARCNAAPVLDDMAPLWREITNTQVFYDTIFSSEFESKRNNAPSQPRTFVPLCGLPFNGKESSRLIEKREHANLTRCSTSKLTIREGWKAWSKCCNYNKPFHITLNPIFHITKMPRRYLKSCLDFLQSNKKPQVLF